MGQIVSSSAKPKRCNANQLSQVPTPAAGEHILVSSDNSMNAAGQGNFDYYIEGDGTKAATALPLIKTYANDVDTTPTSGSNNLIESDTLCKLLIEIDFTEITGKYIRPNGTIGNSNAGFYTSPIFVRAGSTLTYSIEGYGCAILSTYDNGVYTPIVVAPSSLTQYTNETFTAEEDCYVVFCGTPRTLRLTSDFSRIDSLKAELSACVLKVEQSLSLSEQKQVRRNLGLGNGNIDDKPDLLSHNIVESSGIANAIDNIIGREANYVDGRYLLSTGSNAGDSAWMYSVDYIQASEGDVVIWHPAVVKSNAVILIYNSSKEVISFYTANAVERTLTMPANTAYIRASFAKENTSGIYLKINGLDAWQPYDAVQPIMPIVENSLNSTSETNALSANMGRELERERILRLTGNNTIFETVIYDGVILPEHRYKIHLLNKDFDITGDTISTTHTRLEFKYKFADSSESVMLYNMNSTAVLKDSYEFSIPEGVSDVSFYIAGRATLGEVVKFVLEDITDKNTSDFTNTYIASKCSTFRGLFSAAGASTLSFLFFTDPHLMGTNGTFDAGKYKEWMGIIENYYHNIPTDFCLCGGDLLNSGDTPAQACDKLGYVDGTSRKSLYPYKFMLGNHDTNYLGTEELSQNAIDAILFREEGRAYYRFDTDNCTCFVFDTGKDNDHSQSAYRIAQYGFFKDGLLLNVKDNIVLFFHIYYYNSTNQAVMANDIMDMAGAFNNRASVTIAGTTYDFSAVTHGTIRFAIVGHSHFDFDVVDNGIPVIGTLNVQKNGESPSFDMVLADFSNNVINLVRVGQGSDRTIQM